MILPPIPLPSLFRGMDAEDPCLDKSDVISHLMNSHCASHASPTCAEVSRRVKPSAEMPPAVTGVVIDHYCQGELSAEASGQSFPQLESGRVTAYQRAHDAVEEPGKRSPQQLTRQHRLHLYNGRAHSVDDIKTRIVGYISSGNCEASGFDLCPSPRRLVASKLVSSILVRQRVPNISKRH